MHSSAVSLWGVRLDLGAADLGTFDAPTALRDQGIVTKLQHSGLHITDMGDITARKRSQLSIGEPALPYLDEIIRINSELAARVDHALHDGKQVVVLGGDHSVNLGAFSGASTAFNGDIGLIYIDAHGDMNTPESSLSHNIHGMHLASLMGFGPRSMVQLHRPDTKLAVKNLLHIGASDLDEAEKQLIADHAISAVTMFDLLTGGMTAALEAIAALCSRTSRVWVSIDLDAIDCLYAPAVGIPNQGGLTYREIALLTEFIGSHCTVAGIDLVEYCPSLDENHKTAELSIELIAKLLGSNYSWYTTYMDRQTTAP